MKWKRCVSKMHFINAHRIFEFDNGHWLKRLNNQKLNLKNVKNSFFLEWWPSNSHFWCAKQLNNIFFSFGWNELNKCWHALGPASLNGHMWICFIIHCEQASPRASPSKCNNSWKQLSNKEKELEYLSNKKKEKSLAEPTKSIDLVIAKISTKISIYIEINRLLKRTFGFSIIFQVFILGIWNPIFNLLRLNELDQWRPRRFFTQNFIVIFQEM